MSDLVWTLHTVSGVVGRVPKHFLEHATFGEYLVEVEPHTKSFEPELWKPTTAAEFKARRDAAKKTDDDPKKGNN